eukprot:c47994_g1_i1.p1 GENE.c47994_g1_i1~~c47994_g1_i1.p1  ORF type:complete len:237 (+),score=46.93 c47994_g1_i1:91-711(+)
MAAAFMVTPPYLEIYRDIQDPQAVENALAWLFQRNIDMSMRLGNQIFCLKNPEDESQLIAAVMLTLPDVPQPSLLDMVRAGLPLLAWKYGWGTMRRVLSITGWIDKHNVTFFGSEPSASLHRMVVAPGFQGQGLGSRLLAEVLKDHVDSRGLRCILDTQAERNVTYYQKHGFEVVGSAEYTKEDGQTFNTWFMQRPAQQSDANVAH